MLFIAMLLIGLLIPFLFYKVKAKWAKWAPALVLIAGTLAMGVKAKIFPGPEMEALGEVVYFMLLGVAAIGAVLGGIVMVLLTSRNK